MHELQNILQEEFNLNFNPYRNLIKLNIFLFAITNLIILNVFFKKKK